MKWLHRNEDGYAMVMALSFVTALALLAAIIVGVATTEKQTTFNETTHTQAFYSADAGGEVAINWLRFQNSPPPMLDNDGHVFVPTGYTPLNTKNEFRYDVQYRGKRWRPGWSHQYKDFQYEIESDGSSSQNSEASVEVQALRLYREGY
jgi:type II secretory pathway component PulK